MKNSFGVSFALAAAAMLMAGPAAAVSSATATVSGFSYVLYDLKPDDGNPAVLTVLSPASQSYVGVYSNSESSYDGEWADGHWSPTEAMAMLPFGHAHASTDAGSATAMGHVSGPASGGRGDFYAGAYGITSGFSLSPWTGIVMTMSFDGTASTTVGNNQEFASATGQMGVSISSVDGWENHYGYRQVNVSCIWDGFSCVGTSASGSSTFSLGYANMSDAVVEGNMYAYAYASGQSTVPVPEAQTWAMLLAGLAGIGTLVRRRRAA